VYVPPVFSFGKKIVDLIKEIDGLFIKTKEHYAHRVLPVKRNQYAVKNILCNVL
jgi:hypothetical protein